MSPEQWEKVKDWFARLEELPAGERERLLAKEVDPEVVREAARLLALNDADCPKVDDLQPPAEWVRDALELHAFRDGDVAAERFRIVRFLAAGGMGEVYEAEDLELHERVAVKTLRPELAITESAYLRFKQEIQLSRKVTHPNVCRIHDLWRHTREGGRTTHFLTMELLEGETLAARLAREGRMDPAVVLSMARQMVEGLEAAHAAGVIHRDLKPGNVMLVGERVVITDFGLSRSLSVSGATVTGSTLGTPAYMAPEQIEGAEMGPATDIYSMGVLLYEMVTGRLPFRGGSVMALAVKKMRETPPPPSSLVDGLPPTWDRAILACLAQEPEYRFQSARALLVALEGQPGAAIPRRRRDRIPARVWQVAFVAALAVLGTLLYWQFRPGYRPPAEAQRWYNDGVAALHEESPQKARLLLEKAVAADSNFAAAHARLAQAYAELDMADRAKEELLRSADLRDPPGGLTDAVRKFVLRDFAEATVLFERLETGPGTALDTAKAMALNGDTDGAAKRYQDLLRQEPENPTAWLQLGALQGQRRETEAALLSLGKAAEGFRLRGNLEGLTAVALRRSEEHLLAKDTAQVEAELRKVMEMARTTENLYLEAAVLGRLGTVAAFAGRFGDAKKINSQLASQVRANGFNGLLARNYYDLGIRHFSQYQYEEAEAALRKSLEIATEGRLKLAAANAQLQLAQTLSRTARTAEALPLLDAATAHYTESKQRAAQFQARVIRLNLLIDLGRNAEVTAGSRQLLADARAGARLNEMAQAMGLVAHAAMHRADFPEAYAIHGEMRGVYERLNRKSYYLQSLLNEANARVSEGDAAKAGELLAEAELRLSPDDRAGTAKWRQIRSHLAATQGQGSLAVEEATRASGLSPVASAMTLSSAYLAKQDAPAALRAAETAIEMLAKSSDSTAGLEAQTKRARALYAMGRYQEAVNVVEPWLIANDEEVQRFVRCLAAGIYAAALTKARDSRAQRASALAREQFEQTTKTWSAESKKRFYERADLQVYKLPGEIR